MHKTPIFSVTKKDFDLATFSVGGHGGSGKDTSNTGVRITHRQTGISAEGREYRSQSQNKQAAFKRLVANPKFQKYLQIETARRLGQPQLESPEQIMARVDKTIATDLANGSIIEQLY